MQEYAKHFAWWLLSTFWGESARKNISLYPEIGQSFIESYEDVSLLRTLKYFE